MGSINSNSYHKYIKREALLGKPWLINYNLNANVVVYDQSTGLPIEDEGCYYAATCSDGSTDCSCNIFGCQDAAACN